MSATLDDGYIIGMVLGTHRQCEHCDYKTVCVKITGLMLPKGMTVKATILQDRKEDEPHRITYIGVGCGCYAKFHRQVAHINDKRMRVGDAV